jgi:adenylate cyclase
MAAYPKGTVTFLFTDVVDSSGLWERHHDATEAAMANHDAIVNHLVSTHGGVVVKHTGDGAFAVFTSAIDAARASLDLNAVLLERDWGLHEAFLVRMGLHTGEAVFREDDYFGAAVNRAARVMGLAGGGEVFVSLATQQVVRGRLPEAVELRDLGERELRGMSDQEHVFQLTTRSDPTTQAHVPPKPHASKRDRRAAWIAVLPFDNMSGDPDQGFFADGVSDDVLTGLAGFKNLRVIARTSSFGFRNTKLPISEIGTLLGVQFVLEGSVRKVGNSVRVTAQLIDAETGNHVWADRYDDQLDDIFAVQDRITEGIVVAIDPAIRSAATQRSRPENLDAWEHYQLGWTSLYRYRPEANVEARQHFEAAIELDPMYAGAYAGLSATHFLDAWLNWRDDKAASVTLAYETAKSAVRLDESDSRGYGALAGANYAMGRLDRTLVEAERAIQLNPSLVWGHVMAAAATVHGSDPEAGIPMAQRAIDLSPQDPTVTWSYGLLAMANFLMKRPAEAIASARIAIGIRYGYLLGRVLLTASLVESNDLDAARQEAAAILEINPEFTTEMLEPYQWSDANRQRVVEALRVAGVEN